MKEINYGIPKKKNNDNKNRTKWLYDELPRLEADKVVTGADPK